MTAGIRHITIDCADAYQLAQFWSEVVGHPVHQDDNPGDDEVLIELPEGPGILFIQVPEATCA